MAECGGWWRSGFLNLAGCLLVPYGCWSCCAVGTFQLQQWGFWGSATASQERELDSQAPRLFLHSYSPPDSNVGLHPDVSTATAFTGVVGSAMMAGTVFVFLPVSPRCSNTPTQMYQCVALSIMLVCWAEESLLDYGYLISCRFKVWYKESPHFTVMLSSL